MSTLSNDPSAPVAETDTAFHVSVLGLGAMGSALARAFLAAGFSTTVWNRSPGRADTLVASGAVEAASVADAVAASSLIVINVLDTDAVTDVLDAAGASVHGVAVVNLTSSTPQDARRISERATAAGARYLDGAIMVPTPLIGTDDTLVLYSGDTDLFDIYATTLRELGGDAVLLGSDPGMAAVYDLGMLDIFFNGMAAFLHAAALVGANGVGAKTFLPYADRIVSVLHGSMVGLADDVDRGEYAGAEDNLDMELRALDHIVETSEAYGIDTTVPELPRALVMSAIARGHGRDGFSRTIEILRSPGAES